jgi:hypothetical protein
MRLHESNWPLLTVSKGFFEGLTEEDKTFGSSSQLLQADPNDAPTDQWGDIDIPDDDKEVNPYQVEGIPFFFSLLSF